MLWPAAHDLVSPTMLPIRLHRPARLLRPVRPGEPLDPRVHARAVGAEAARGASGAPGSQFAQNIECPVMIMIMIGGPVASVSVSRPSFHQSDLYLLTVNREGRFVCCLRSLSTFHVFRAARNMQLGSRCTRQRG